jgi:hypothetical protein
MADMMPDARNCILHSSMVGYEHDFQLNRSSTGMACGKQHPHLMAMALLYSIAGILHLASPIFCCRRSSAKTANSERPRGYDILQVFIVKKLSIRIRCGYLLVFWAFWA